MDRLKVLITGVTGFRNRGVEALVIPLIEAIQDRYSDANITIATCSPDYDKRRLEEFRNVELVHDAYLSSGSWASPRPIGLVQTIRKKINSKLRLKDERIESRPPSELLPYRVPDLVIVSGGDIISSDYGTASLKHVLEPIFWAKAHHIPCALLGQSIGIFKSQEHISLWTKAEGNASLITIREPISYNYVNDQLGAKCQNISLAADIAFLLHPSQSLRQEVLKSKECPVIAVAISSLISQYSSNGHEAHVIAWAGLIRRLVDQYDARVIIIPHVQEGYSDDRDAATQVFRLLQFDHRVDVAGADYSASEFKAIISTCDMVIAERMHAAIAGFSSGVCTMPVSYSIKAQGITSQIYESSPCSASDICLSIDELHDLDIAFSRVDALWSNRAQHAQIIGGQLSKIEQLAKNNLDCLFELINLQVSSENNWAR